MQFSTGGTGPFQALHNQNSESSNISNGDVIYIGVAVALNGHTDWLGWRQLNSVELAVDEVNSAGGIEIGGKITISKLSTQTANAMHHKQFQRLIRWYLLA